MKDIHQYENEIRSLRNSTLKRAHEQSVPIQLKDKTLVYVYSLEHGEFVIMSDKLDGALII